MRSFYVYTLANREGGTIHVGVTSDIRRRAWEHADGAVASFTRKYGLHRLVYLEETSDIRAAIAREKQMKNWKRAWKIALIEKENPRWKDLRDLT
jgi:putative endonuclease